jgi:hypothetical protein
MNWMLNGLGWRKQRLYVLILKGGNDWQQILLPLEIVTAGLDTMVILMLVNALEHTY